MKKLQLIVIFLIMGASTILAATDVSGNLIENDTWTLLGSPYNIVGDFGVPSGISLTIEAGVEVNYMGDYKILVIGSIRILGEESNPVIINGNSNPDEVYYINAENRRSILIRRSDLGNSIISNANFLAGAGLQIGDESDSKQDNPKNTDTLVVSDSKFISKSFVHAKGYETGALMYIENCTFINSTIWGIYPRSERIELINSTLDGSVILSESDNYGINIDSSILKNCSLISEEKIEITGSKLFNCNTEYSSFRTVGYLKIDRSIVVNSYIESIANTALMNSIFFSDRDDQALVKIATGTIEKSSFFSFNASSALTFTSYGSSSGKDMLIANSTFMGFDSAVSVLRTDTGEDVAIGTSNFLQNRLYALKNNSNSSINAQQNYWDSNSATIIASMIYDSGDDLELGTVDYSNRLEAHSLTAPISPPLDVVLSDNGNGGVNVNWTANEEADVAGYKLYYRSGSVDGIWYLADHTVIDAGNVTAYNIPGLSIADTVAVTVYDIDADGVSDMTDGHESWYSFATPPPSAIPSFSLTQIDFSEVMNGNTASRELVVTNVGNQPLTISNISYPEGFSGDYANGTLQPSDQVTITITFAPTVQQSYGGDIVFTTDQTSGPTTVSVTGVGGGDPRYELRITPNSLDFGAVELYIVPHATQSAWMVNEGNVSIQIFGHTLSSGIHFSSTFSTDYTNPTIQPGDSIEIRIMCSPEATGNLADEINFNNTSPDISTITGDHSISLSAFGFDATIPDQVQNLQVSNIEFDRFSASWDAASQAATYKWEVATDEDFTSVVLTGNNVVIGDLPVLVSVLNELTTYYFRVAGVNDASVAGSWSEPVTIHTPSEDPFAPIVSQATGITTTGFTGNWNAVDGVLGYRVDVSEDNFSTFLSGYQDADVGQETSIAVDGLLDATTYQYRVRSEVTSGTFSKYSGTMDVTTALAPPVAVVPGNPALGLRTSEINWSAARNAQSYRYTVASDESFTTIVNSIEDISTTQLSALLEGLLPATQYYYRVRSVNAAGAGGIAVGDFTTLTDTEVPAGEIVTSILPDQMEPGPREVRVSVSDNDEIGTVQFYKKAALTSAFSGTAATDGVGHYKGLLTSDDFDDFGVAFFFEITDYSGNKGYTDTLAIRTQLPSTSVVQVPEVRVGKNVKNYQIIAYPYQPQLVTTVLSDLGTFDNTYWRLFTYNKGFTEYPAFQSLQPGQGYWLIIDKNLSSITINGEKTPVAAPYELTLDQGWNQIGNPYPNPIDWNQVISSSNLGAGDISSLITWDKGYVSATKLDAFEGGFVFANEGGLVLTFPIAAIEPDNGRIADVSVSINRLAASGGNQLFFDLEADGMRYSAGGIGYHPQAFDQKDQFDMLSLPHFSEYLTLTHSNGLTMDVVEKSDLMTWDFSIESNKKDEQVAEMNWEAFIIAPNEALLLQDMQTMELVDMTSQSKHQFFLSSSQKFKVAYGKEELVEDYFKVDQGFITSIYPNPTEDKLTIKLRLPDEEGYSGQMSVHLMDLSGRSLDRVQLNLEELSGETYEYRPANKPTPGVYFIRVELLDGEGNKRISEHKIYFN